jgi:hypothetical protein
MSKNTVRRVFQITGWQVKKRPIGFRPRIKAQLLTLFALICADFP